MYYLLPESGLLRIAGQHQVDFLQRQTTNDVLALAPRRALLAVLTNPTARILDVFTLYRREGGEKSEPELMALTLPGRAAISASYLKSRIFFMDRVTVEDASLEFVQIDLAGAGGVLNALELPAPPQPGEVLTGKVNGTRLTVIGPIQGSGLGYRLVLPAPVLEPVLHLLNGSGALRLEQEEYDIHRILAGLPGPNELTEEYTPLEVGLHGAISDRKGCYTGQEVIARQLTYDKVTRHLVGLRLGSLAPEGSIVMAGGKQVGMITSIRHSARYGPIALAVLRRPAHEPGRTVVVNASGREIIAQVESLPFREA